MYDDDKREATRVYINAQNNYWDVVRYLYRFTKFTKAEAVRFINARNSVNEAKILLKEHGLVSDGYKVFSTEVFHGSRGNYIVESVVYHKSEQTPKDKESYVYSRLSKYKITRDLGCRERPLTYNGINSGIPYDRKLAHTGVKRRGYIV